MASISLEDLASIGTTQFAIFENDELIVYQTPLELEAPTTASTWGWSVDRVDGFSSSISSEDINFSFDTDGAGESNESHTLVNLIFQPSDWIDGDTGSFRITVNDGTGEQQFTVQVTLKRMKAVFTIFKDQSSSGILFDAGLT